jgi:hypothetical protein
MRTLLLSMTLALAVAAPAAAAEREYPSMTDAQAAGIERVTTPFFSSLKEKAYAKAYTDLFAGTLLASKTVEVQQLISQTTFIMETYGPIERWEVFESECATTDICRVKLATYTTNGPVYFWISLYQRNGEWKPTYILMGDTPQFVF